MPPHRGGAADALPVLVVVLGWLFFLAVCVAWRQQPSDACPAPTTTTLVFQAPERMEPEP